LRPVLAKKATLQEIENHWSLLDLMNINEAMDIEEEIEDYYSSRMKKK